jgi:hypothetical protein
VNLLRFSFDTGGSPFVDGEVTFGIGGAGGMGNWLSVLMIWGLASAERVSKKKLQQQHGKLTTCRVVRLRSLHDETGPA